MHQEVYDSFIEHVQDMNTIRMRHIILLGVASLFALMVAEVGFRIFLYSSCAKGTGHRNPQLYASYFDDDAYWLLLRAWSEESPTFTTHPQLGWVGHFDPQTFRHDDEEKLKGRIPVLLFGDSFSSCVPEETCFEDILDANPEISTQYYVLNYGVGGYGIDQIYMLMEKVLPLYPRAPIIAGMMTYDIDRAQLRFRDANKPKFDVQNQTLVYQHKPTDEVPLAIGSFLYRKILFSKYFSSSMRRVLRREEHIRAEKITRTRMILTHMQRLLEHRKAMYLVFHPLNIDEEQEDWRMNTFTQWFQKNQVEWSSTWDISLHHKRERTFFIRPDDGHPTTAYNRLIAERMRAFILEQHPLK